MVYARLLEEVYNMNPKKLHKQFLQRQGVFERRYARLFLVVLRKQYEAAAAAYPTPYIVNPEDYKPVLGKLYAAVLPSEAQQAWNDFVKPLAGDRKDFFDDLMSMLGINTPDGEWIRIWRDTASEWLNLNILTKITNISSTTQRAIAKVIEDKLNQGETSIVEIRSTIMEASNGEVNKHRATLIARTETMQAMNKGRRLAMYSSGLEWTKKWIDTPDKRTRLSHRAVALEDYKPLGEPYWLVDRNGGLEPCYFPGDPQLSASNCINCRCTEIYQVLRDAAGRPIRTQDKPSGSYAELI